MNEMDKAATFNQGFDAYPGGVNPHESGLLRLYWQDGYDTAAYYADADKATIGARCIGQRVVFSNGRDDLVDLEFLGGRVDTAVARIMAKKVHQILYSHQRGKDFRNGILAAYLVDVATIGEHEATLRVWSRLTEKYWPSTILRHKPQILEVLRNAATEDD